MNFHNASEKNLAQVVNTVYTRSEESLSELQYNRSVGDKTLYRKSEHKREKEQHRKYGNIEQMVKGHRRVNSADLTVFLGVGGRFVLYCFLSDIFMATKSSLHSDFY
jgi:hypothetical protein